MHQIACRVRDVVLIGDSVRVAVLEVNARRVRLGITTPGEFPEYREEEILLSTVGEIGQLQQGLLHV